MNMARRQRPPDELRPVKMTRGYTEMTPGSVLIEMGETRVLCTAAVDQDVPRWMRDSGKGWVTAEYGMLPGSSPQRIRRDAYSGGRSKEISRLIGRSLRSVVRMEGMEQLTVRVDCDVLQADGGTRTASITGAWVALADAFDKLVADGVLEKSPIAQHIAAVSVGVVDGEVLLDLEYKEDVNADTDCNVVMTGDGKFVEVQGTAEGVSFDRSELDRMLDLASDGIATLVSYQKSSRA